MSDDPVEQALAELQDLVRCCCHPAYTGRGMRDPDCECDSAEAVMIVADRIEAQAAEIERQVREKRWIMKERDRTFALVLARAEMAEARLAKAVEALEKFACKCPSNCDWEQDDICPSWTARTTLAELGGQDDD